MERIKETKIIEKVGNTFLCQTENWWIAGTRMIYDFTHKLPYQLYPISRVVLSLIFNSLIYVCPWVFDISGSTNFQSAENFKIAAALIRNKIEVVRIFLFDLHWEHQRYFLQNLICVCWYTRYVFYNIFWQWVKNIGILTSEVY